jgi:hypothetical protein
MSNICDYCYDYFHTEGNSQDARYDMVMYCKCSGCGANFCSPSRERIYCVYLHKTNQCSWSSCPKCGALDVPPTHYMCTRDICLTDKEYITHCRLVPIHPPLHKHRWNPVNNAKKKQRARSSAMKKPIARSGLHNK